MKKKKEQDQKITERNTAGLHKDNFGIFHSLDIFDMENLREIITLWKCSYVSIGYALIDEPNIFIIPQFLVWSSPI